MNRKAPSRIKRDADRERGVGETSAPWHTLVLLAGTISWISLTVGYRFIADDFAQIFGNPAIAGHQWRELWTTGTWQALEATAPYFRPLQASLFSLQQMIFGNDPAGYHLIEAMLAGIAGYTWFAFLGEIGLPRTSLLLAALIWVSSPGNASTIAWVSCSADCLCLALGVIAVAVWTLGKSGPQWMTASLVWGLALLSKEWAGLWPIFAITVFLLCGPDRPGRGQWKEVARRFWTAGVVLAGWLVYRAAVLGTVLGRAVHPELDAWTTVRLAGGFFFRYLRSLAAFYPASLWPTLWPHRQASWSGLLLGLFCLAVLAAWTWWLYRAGSRLGAVCAAMIPVFLAPALMIGQIPWPVVFNARYLFFVTPFFSVAMAETAVRVLPRRRIAPVMAAWVAISLLCQYRDIQPWRDQGTFFQAAVRRSPDSAAAIGELARIRAQEGRQGQTEEAEWALSGFLRAAALTKSSPRADLRPIRRNAEAGAATVLLAERRPEAVVMLLKDSPDLNDATLANALAGAEMALQRDTEANAILVAALRKHPQDYGLHARRAWLLASQNECGAAKIEEDAAQANSGEAMTASFGALKTMLERACGE